MHNETTFILLTLSKAKRTSCDPSRSLRMTSDLIFCIVAL